MSDDRQIQVLLEQAEVQRRLNNHKGAIELLQRALSLDPDHARAHAALALALLGAKRLPGAAIEARMAIHLDGNDAYCHYAAAAVMAAHRKLADAWSHCLVAIENDQHDVDARVLGAHIRTLRNEPVQARELLGEALELQPTHAGALTQLARHEYAVRDYDAAARRIHEALRSDPDDLEAHAVAGLIDLAKGDDGSAETHARFILSQDATDQGGLELWAAVKAHRSWALGVWWRLNVWVSNRSETGQMALLIGSFVVVRVAIILAGALDLDRVEWFLGWAWLGFCAYTWFAPELFKKMLQADLGSVHLDPRY